MENEEILRISQRRQAADKIRRHDFQHHGIFDIEVGEATGHDRERNDDEERNVVRDGRRKRTAQRDECQRKRARCVES